MLTIVAINTMWDKLIHKFDNSLREVWQQLSGWAAEHLLNIIIIIIGAFILRRVATRTLSRIIRHTTMRHDLFPTETDRKKRVQTLDSLIGALMHVLVWVIATMMIVSELGINAGPLIASAGVIGVALGFGAQSLIKDFMSGMFIIVENQYRVGDVIEIGNVSGTVEAISIRTTVIRDLDGNLHHVPNGTITVTTNKTMHYARINEDITVGLHTDIDQLVHVINHVGEEMSESVEFQKSIIEPPQFDRIVRFSPDGIVVKVLGKTVAGEQWRVSGEMYKRLKKAFEKHRIEIPHAQLTITKK